MPYSAAIRGFLSRHHGYYCDECLAARLNISIDEMRRSVSPRMFAEVTRAYRICQSCLEEKSVFALRLAPDLAARRRARAFPNQRLRVRGPVDARPQISSAY